jgi:transcription initiation factor TFIIIB Brf1 subunit/transcription initiation factor TFIIB
MFRHLVVYVLNPKTMDNDFFTSTQGIKNTSPEDALFDAWLESEKDVGYEKKELFKSCESCGAEDDMILQEEIIVCMSCGEIIARPIDSSAEYRYFGIEDRNGGDPSRIGAPSDPHLPESSLGTIILPQGNAKHMGKVRRYHQWNMLPYKERALLGAFDRLALAANNHGFGGSIVEDSKELYVKLNGLCDRRGLSRDSLLASCVYTALKRAGSPRKPQEVGEMFSLSHASFTKAFKFFQEVLAQAMQKGLIGENWAPSNLKSTRAADYVALPLSKLPISRADYQKLLVEAQTLADRAEVEGMSPENTPPSLAAGVVAYVCEKWRKGEIPLPRIATSCDISLATLQKCLRRLQTILGA